MEQLALWIVEQLKSQGVSVVMILLAAWYFYRRQTQLEAKLERAHEQYLAYLREDRAAMIKVLEENNDVLQRNTHVIQQFESLIFQRRGPKVQSS